MKIRERVLEALKDGPLFPREVHERTGIWLCATYHLLRGMEEDGLLKSREVHGLPNRGGRPARIYELAGRG